MTDDEIVAALKGGDPKAVEAMVSLYGNRLLRSAFLLCGNEADAQDLAQDTLLRAVRSAHRFRGESALYTYLHGILLNLTRRYYRKRKRTVLTDEIPNRAASDQPPSSQADAETLSSILLDAIRRLSAPHREVIVLRYYEEMKIGEIARQIGATKGTVKSRLHYAVKHLRELVPPELNLFRSDGTYEWRKP